MPATAKLSFRAACLFTAALLCAPGCSGKKELDPDTQRKTSELREICDSFMMFNKNHQRSPKQLSDLHDYRPIFPIGLQALQEGQYVAVWGVDMSSKDGNTVVAYEKDAPKQGGSVVTADGNVKTMSAEELQAALKGKG